MINIAKPTNQYETEQSKKKKHPSSVKNKDLLNLNIKFYKNKSTSTLEQTLKNKANPIFNFYPSPLQNKAYTPMYKKQQTKIKTKLTKKKHSFSRKYSTCLKSNISFMDVSFPQNVRPKSNIKNFNKNKSEQNNIIIKDQNESFQSAYKKKNILEIENKFNKYENIVNNLRLKFHGNILLTKDKLNSFLFNQGMLKNYKKNKFYQNNVFSVILNKIDKENESNNGIPKITSLFKNEMIKNSMNESYDKSLFLLKRTLLNKNGDIERLKKPNKLKIYNYKYLNHNQ